MAITLYENDASEKKAGDETRLKALETAVKDIGNKVDLIYVTLVGNETFDQQGVIQRLKIVEKQGMLTQLQQTEKQAEILRLSKIVDELEKENVKNKAFKNKIVGAFFAGGALWTVIWELITNYVIK